MPALTPTWENTFNSRHRVREWGHIGYVMDHARRGGYPYFLWNDLVYFTNEACTPTGYGIGDLYPRRVRA